MSELANKYPCLEYNLSILNNDTDKLEMFYSFLKGRGVSLDNIIALSALYASMGLLPQRCRKEDFDSISVADVSCETINVGDGSMCCSCRESAKYTNRWYDEECQLLAACFAYDGLRETLRKRYKSKVETLFCSHVRVSLSMKESLYVPINRFVFTNYNTIFFEWIKRVGADADLVNDLAQRAYPAVNDAVKAVYPKWRTSNEEFLKNHITELVYRAIAIKRPVEHYIQLASKMYEALKPAKTKKSVQKPVASLSPDKLGDVGVLLTNEALIAAHNAEQRERARKQVVETTNEASLEMPEKTEKEVVAEDSPVRNVDIPAALCDSLDEENDSAADVNNDEKSNAEGVSAVDESADTLGQVIGIRELRERKKAAERSSRVSYIDEKGRSVPLSERNLFNSELKHLPVPFRPTMTYAACYDRDLSTPLGEEPEWRSGFWECCEAYNVVYVDSPAKLESLDATVLGNDIVACEVLKDTLGEYLMMYLPKQSLFVVLPSNMLAQTSAILTTFFKLKNMIKLTCYPLPLFNWLCREMLPCEGIYDIRTISGMVWHDKLSSYHIDEICDYRTFIGIVSGVASDGSRPDIIYGMPKYRVVYLEARRVLSQGNYMSVLRREMAYLLLVGRSFNLLGILENCSIPFIEYELTHEGLGRVVYEFTDKVTFVEKGCLVSGKYLSQEREDGGLFRAYKEVCIKIVLSHYFVKYEPMLINLDEESGITFFVGERDCADFYTLLNRYLLQCGNFYVSTEPIVSMEIVTV